MRRTNQDNSFERDDDDEDGERHPNRRQFR